MFIIEDKHFYLITTINAINIIFGLTPLFNLVISMFCIVLLYVVIWIKTFYGAFRTGSMSATEQQLSNVDGLW